MAFLDTLKLDIKSWRLAQRHIAVLHTVDPVDGGITPVATGTLGGAAAAVTPGSGTILGQVTAPIDGTSRTLTSPPAGAGYAFMQIQGSGISARFDGAPATGAAGEIQYAADGFLELTSAAEIAAFVYIRSGTGTGNLNIVYRSN